MFAIALSTVHFTDEEFEACNRQGIIPVLITHEQERLLRGEQDVRMTLMKQDGDKKVPDVRFVFKNV